MTTIKPPESLIKDYVNVGDYKIHSRGQNIHNRILTLMEQTRAVKEGNLGWAKYLGKTEYGVSKIPPLTYSVPTTQQTYELEKPDVIDSKINIDLKADQSKNKIDLNKIKTDLFKNPPSNPTTLHGKPEIGKPEIEQKEIIKDDEKEEKKKELKAMKYCLK